MALVVSGCAVDPPPPPKPPKPAPAPKESRLTLTPTTFAALPGWTEDNPAQALGAFRRSCDRFRPQPSERVLDNLGAAKDIARLGLAGRIADWRPICEAAARLVAPDPDTARAFFEAWLVPYLAADNGNSQGLFTGYYEAELRGARKKGGKYRVPIYAPPRDLVAVDLGRFKGDWKGSRINGRVENGRLVPYHTRGEIENGALDGKADPLLWVDDPMDAFILHIQGSGRVVMEDGSVERIGFAERNGHPYRSIGRVLIKRGELTRHGASMQAIRRWIDANPQKSAGLMAENPSYIFFRRLKGDEGPLGAQGVALTAGRSLAVDHRFVPYGVPLWLETTWPNTPDRPLRRLMVAQDTGGAIKGPVRGDFFWGHGREAAAQAGRMKQKGRYWLLLPRGIAGWDMRQAVRQGGT